MTTKEKRMVANRGALPLIKVAYIGFWDKFDPDTFFVTEILKKHFTIQICDDPDFVICSCIGDFYSYLQYDCPRIMMIGENYIPDFNTIDYAITPYPIQLFDRCFHFPQGLSSHSIDKYLCQRSRGEVFFKETDLNEKTIFANFCASHESDTGARGSFFKQLCKYKKVDSIGSYLNNTGYYANNYSQKHDYQKKCKFSLCFEATCHGGFNTEKIVHAFYNNTIPVYYGDPNIGDVFNKKAFIDVSDYPSFEAAIERIIELDQDDEAYLQMLNEPIFDDPNYTEKMWMELEDFLIHIFQQDPNLAYRRSRAYYAHYYESFLNKCRKIYSARVTKAAMAGRSFARKIIHPH